jgi:hypothetical protein
VVLFHIQNGISHGSESLSPTVVTESDKRYKHGGNEHLIIKKKNGSLCQCELHSES